MAQQTIRPSTLQLPPLRTLKVLVLVLGLAGLVALVGGIVLHSRQTEQAALDDRLASKLEDQTARMRFGFQRSRDVVALLARNPAFSGFYMPCRPVTSTRRVVPLSRFGRMGDRRLDSCS